MTCAYCHDYRADGSNYCGNCGEQLREECGTCMEPLDETTFSEYQELSRQTAQGYAHPSVAAGQGTPKEKAMFLALALNGEAGELGEKVKKYVREDDAEYLDQAEAELGDVLWYMAQLASLLNVDLGDVADDNLDKLLDRQERGVITGQGDDR